MKSPIRSRFLLDHEQLEVALGELIAAFETGDRDITRDAYARFATGLSEHLAMEEQLLFPELLANEPAEVEALQAAHRSMRAKVDELGIGVELHQTRLPTIRALVDMLHDHAAREDAMLYRWADRVLSDPARRPKLESFFTHPVAHPVPR